MLRSHSAEGTRGRGLIAALSFLSILGAIVFFLVTKHMDKHGSHKADLRHAQKANLVEKKRLAPDGTQEASSPSAPLVHASLQDPSDDLSKDGTDPMKPPETEADQEADETEHQVPALPEELDLHGKDRRDFLIAAFDLNDDTRLDLILFEKEDLKVGQVFIGGENGELEEATTAVKVPAYLTRFLALAAEEGSMEGPVEIQTDDGNLREVVLFGKK